MSTGKGIKISAKEFDERFEKGEDMIPYVDLSKARQPNKERTVRVTLPGRVIAQVERVAVREGVTKQRLIEGWITDHVQGGATTVRGRDPVKGRAKDRVKDAG
jgi:hypothetical protein